MDDSLVIMKGFAWLNESMSHALQDHPGGQIIMESYDKNVVDWRREEQTTPVALPREPHEQYEKAETYDSGSKLLEIMTDRESWWAVVHGVTKSRIQLTD